MPSTADSVLWNDAYFSTASIVLLALANLMNWPTDTPWICKRVCSVYLSHDRLDADDDYCEIFYENFIIKVASMKISFSKTRLDSRLNRRAKLTMSTSFFLKLKEINKIWQSFVNNWQKLKKLVKISWNLDIILQ
jgi:hypothetical protein